MALRHFSALALLGLASACSAGGSSSDGDGGSSGSSGSAGSGGTASGGTSGQGTGATSSGGASGSGGGSAGIGGGNAGTGGGNAGTGGGEAGTGGGDAGTGGGSAGTGGGGATPLFFDDFEAATIGPSWIERNVASDSVPMLDGTRAHSGSQSLHVTATGFSQFLAIEGGPVFPAPDNTFYARVWLYVPGEQLAQGHVVWLEAGDVDNDQHEVRLGANIGALQTNLYRNGEVDLRAPGVFTTNAWHCIELKFGNDELVVWLNGNQVDGISTTDWLAKNPSDGGDNMPRSGWSPTYEAFRLGWELSGPPNEIWYDDVALSHSPIGCN